MYAAPGIFAREVKEHCGFLLKEGLVSPALSRRMSARRQQCDLSKFRDSAAAKDRSKKNSQPSRRRNRGQSTENRTRSIRARRRAIDQNPELAPSATCKRCGIEFRNTNSLFFAGKFCGLPCRDAHYREQYDRGLNPAQDAGDTACVCGHCGASFHGNRQQVRRFVRGEPVTCGTACRAARNGKINGARRRRETVKVVMQCAGARAHPCP